MIWLTWRQFRIQAAAVYAAVAAVALVLAITGPRLLDLARIDANVFDRLTRADRNLFYAGIVVMAVTPAIIGAFWGAPLVARELEAGTHRLVWNQTVTRTRWLATKLGVATLAAAVAVGMLTLAISWWSDAIDGALSSTHGGLPSRLTPVTFAMRGIAPIGYAVFAVVLGVTVGVLLRRSLPAMAITLAVFTFVQIAMPLWVRPHLMTPAQQTVTFTRSRLDSITITDNGAGAPMRLSVNTGGAGDWVLSNQTVDAAGQAAALPSWMSDCLPPPPSAAQASGPVKAPAIDNLDSCFDRLTAEGYRQRLVYQPADRFWALQWAETGLFLALSGLLTGFCFWWIRHRLT
jgi:ABC-type transport system involved in multi-copper enzyme maturation permease subunit